MEEEREKKKKDSVSFRRFSSGIMISSKLGRIVLI